MAWNDLTERQKQLDRAIESCGFKLDSSERCLMKVIRTIGARREEEEFVRQRIHLRLRTSELLDKTDAFIANTEAMLDKFEKDDEEWRRKGRALGIDF